MKKLSLVFVMVFAVSMAMAQTNVGLIKQVGIDHDALIKQGGLSNVAKVNQTSDAGREGFDLAFARVTQQGSSNLVLLKQRAFYADDNASIIQWGNGNKVHGMTLADDFLQNHGDNYLDVYMKGNRNTLKSLAPEAQKNDNDFDLKVVGDDNTIAMSQQFGKGDVDIDGDFNDVRLEQTSGEATVAEFNKAEIDIVGDHNDVDVTQTDLTNTATVDILGDSNVAAIVQTSGVVYP